MNGMIKRDTACCARHIKFSRVVMFLDAGAHARLQSAVSLIQR